MSFYYRCEILDDGRVKVAPCPVRGRGVVGGRGALTVICVRDAGSDVNVTS